MKTLQNYTIEELTAEIKRRKKEARLNRPKAQAQYAYLKAVVTWASGHAFNKRVYRARLLPEVRQYADSVWNSKELIVTIAAGSDIRSLNAPRPNDIVVLKDRITKNNPNGFGEICNPKIWKLA